jgi:hypothetical protein
MTRSVLSMLSLVIVTVPGATACIQHACTAIGCFDQASISVHRTDWSRPGWAIDLDLDGTRIVCTTPASAASGARPCDQPNVQVDVRELADCRETRTEAAASVTCTPNGRFEQVITVMGTPKRIAVVLKATDTIAAHRTFDLIYVAGRPNGPDCDPVCRQASASWEIP